MIPLTIAVVILFIFHIVQWRNIKYQSIDVDGLSEDVDDLEGKVSKISDILRDAGIREERDRSWPFNVYRTVNVIDEIDDVREDLQTLLDHQGLDIETVCKEERKEIVEQAD